MTAEQAQTLLALACAKYGGENKELVFTKDEFSALPDDLVLGTKAEADKELLYVKLMN